jgi:hypothetical protein
LLSIWYLLAILGMSYFLFAVNDQGRDFIYTVFLNDDTGYLWISIGFLIFWCFMTWYSCSVSLYDDTSRRKFNTDPEFKRVFGRVIGLMPLLILLTAVLSNEQIKTKMTERLLLSFLFIVIGVLLYFIFKKLSNQKNSDYYPLYSKEYELQYRPPILDKKFVISRMQFIRQNKGVRIYFKWYGGFFAGVILLFLFKPVNYTVSQFLQPPAIVITALSMFIYISTIMKLFHNNRKLPLIHMILIGLYLFSFRNDNGSPNPLLKTNTDLTLKRDSLVPFFKDWVTFKLKEWKDSVKPMPVFLIANQGGGTRGSAWSSLILQKLDADYNGSRFNFYNQIFLMSGASGGGVGGNFYNALKKNNDTVKQELLVKLWEKDHLTPLTAALTFNATLAALLPFKVNALENTKMLEYSWSRSFQELVHPEKFDLNQSFLSMWYKNNGDQYKYPSVMINGVLAETGQKIITSNLILDSNYLGKNLDYHQVTGKDIRYNTAMTFCSRFPVLCSESLVTDQWGKEKGHILDGGLLDNTATGSLYYFVEAIRPYIRMLNRDKQRVEVVLLYIQNYGSDSMPEEKSNSAFRILSNPLNGLLQTSGIGIEQDNKTRLIKSAISSDTDYKYFNLQLGKGPIAYPLGLYMSKTVLGQMVKRVDSFPFKDPALFQFLENYKNNQ